MPTRNALYGPQNADRASWHSRCLSAAMWKLGIGRRLRWRARGTGERVIDRLISVEGDLADRHGIPFTILAIGALPCPDLRLETRRYLEDRTRSSDDVGLFRGRLAVLLRATTVVGATAVRNDVEAWLADRGQSSECELLVYPDPNTAHRAANRRATTPSLLAPLRRRSNIEPPPLVGPSRNVHETQAS